jgi:hypothetical protein
VFNGVEFMLDYWANVFVFVQLVVLISSDRFEFLFMHLFQLVLKM